VEPSETGTQADNFLHAGGTAGFSIELFAKTPAAASLSALRLLSTESHKRRDQTLSASDGIGLNPPRARQISPQAFLHFCSVLLILEQPVKRLQTFLVGSIQTTGR